MFNAETIKKLAEVLKLDVSDFTTKIKSDKEETLEVPTLFTEEDKNAFGTNRFNDGKKAATEILVKDLKTKHNLDFEGKSIDTLLDKFSEKVIADANIAPDEKVKKYKVENEELKGKLQTTLTEKENIKKEYEGKLFHVGITNEVLNHIPKNTTIPANDIADLFMNRHRVTKEDNSVVVYKGDQLLKDGLLNPIPLKDVVAQFSEAYINKNGMGGGDNSGGGTAGKFNTMSSFMDHLKKINVDSLSEQGLKLLSENKKAVTTFDENK
jgi:hypothetical protein